MLMAHHAHHLCEIRLIYASLAEQVKGQAQQSNGVTWG